MRPRPLRHTGKAAFVPDPRGASSVRSYLILSAWSFLAGAGIPLIGVLNSGVARSVGNPFAATAIMFAIAAIVALAFTLPIYGCSHRCGIGISAPCRLCFLKRPGSKATPVGAPFFGH